MSNDKRVTRVVRSRVEMPSRELVSADVAERWLVDGRFAESSEGEGCARTVIAQAEELAENATELERLRSLLDAEEMRQHASDPKVHARLAAENERLDEMRRLVFARNADLTTELARVTASLQQSTIDNGTLRCALVDADVRSNQELARVTAERDALRLVAEAASKAWPVIAGGVDCDAAMRDADALREALTAAGFALTTEAPDER